MVKGEKIMASKQALEERIYQLESALRWPTLYEANENLLGGMARRVRGNKERHDDLYISIYSELQALMDYLGLEYTTIPQSKIIRKAKRK
jgi:hypothetical protein